MDIIFCSCCEIRPGLINGICFECTRPSHNINCAQYHRMREEENSIKPELLGNGAVAFHSVYELDG